MARARNIKPSFFVNEQLSEISFFGRILFIGLWTLADRRGVLENRPKRIKAELFPYDDVSSSGVLSEIEALERLGFIELYESTLGIKEVDKEENSHSTLRKLIYICNFSKHQHPHSNENSNGFLLPSKEKTDSSGALSEHSRSTREERGKRKEERGKINSPIADISPQRDFEKEILETESLCKWIETHYRSSLFANMTAPYIENLIPDIPHDKIKAALKVAIAIFDSEGREQSMRPHIKDLFHSGKDVEEMLNRPIPEVKSSDSGKPVKNALGYSRVDVESPNIPAVGWTEEEMMEYHGYNKKKK